MKRLEVYLIDVQFVLDKMKEIFGEGDVQFIFDGAQELIDGNEIISSNVINLVKLLYSESHCECSMKDAVLALICVGALDKAHYLLEAE